MPFSHSFEILWEVPSQNVRERQHWSKAHRERKMLTNIIAAHRIVLPPMPAHQTKRQIRITAYRKRRIADDANFRGGCKGLLDAMKQAGLIVDDSDKHIQVEYVQMLASEHYLKRPVTSILIY
jgi:Holliday junction resolvase RusA-like endonuclease